MIILPGGYHLMFPERRGHVGLQATRFHFFLDDEEITQIKKVGWRRRAGPEMTLLFLSISTLVPEVDVVLKSAIDVFLGKG